MSTLASRSLLAVCLLFASAPVASAAMVHATLEVQIGAFPTPTFIGSGEGSSTGLGGSATLQAGVVGGIASLPISLSTIIDSFAIGAPGIPGGAMVTAPASNQPLAFDGVTGIMGLNASAYLLMSGLVISEIPLAVVGSGGTQAFHLLSIITGQVIGNPYQLGMVTVMGGLNGSNHTLTATGADARTAAGNGTLVLVSPTVIDMGALGSLAALSTLALEIPEPGALALLGIGVAGLAAVSRRWR